jgi:hypothetical protein
VGTPYLYMLASRNNAKVGTFLDPMRSAISRSDREGRLEKARNVLMDTLNSLRESTLSAKEADAVESALEDELIALRVKSLLSSDPR